MNPVSVNSANILNFGFKVTFDIANRLLKFDLAGFTTYVGGNNINTRGVAFEVIDPSGVIVHTGLSFVSRDIDTASGGTTYNLPIAGGDSIWGVWKIRGAIKDADSQIYYVTIPPKELCKPQNLTDENIVPGAFGINVDCYAPFIQVSETTNLSYLNKSPLSTLKSGVLYWPLGTVGQVAFTFTPFQDNRLYSGTYTVRNATTATYDLNDNAFVEVRYETSLEQKVTCASRVCDVACCISDLQSEYKNNIANNIGRRAKEKIDLISIPLLLAVSKEKCGKEASSEIQEIRDILGCECNCESKAVEGTLTQVGGGNALNVTGACATTVTPSVVGSTTTYTAKTKFTNVVKKDTGDLAFIVEHRSDNCNEYFDISFDYNKLAHTILITIQNDIDLKNLFNSLVIITGVNAAITGIDGKCIANLAACDYFLQSSVQNGDTITGIDINGTVYAAPGGLLGTNEAGIQSWLNGLAKGTFAVSVGADTNPHPISILSTANTNKVNKFIVHHVDTDIEIVFAGTCKGLKELLQAIIDYICTLHLNRIKIGQALGLCSIGSNGNVIINTYGSDTLAGDFIAAMNTAFCALVNKVVALSKVTCADLQAVYQPFPGTPLAPGDMIHGQKGEVCADIDLKELAIYILNLAKTDAQVNAAFCAVECTGNTVLCPDVTDFTGTTSLI